MAESILATEDGRRRALAAVLTLTENTGLAPSRYERELLDRFVWGELTLDEVEARLESPSLSVYRQLKKRDNGNRQTVVQRR